MAERSAPFNDHLHRLVCVFVEGMGADSQRPRFYNELERSVYLSLAPNEVSKNCRMHITDIAQKQLVIARRELPPTDRQWTMIVQ